MDEKTVKIIKWSCTAMDIECSCGKLHKGSKPYELIICDCGLRFQVVIKIESLSNLELEIEPLPDPWKNQKIEPSKIAKEADIRN